MPQTADYQFSELEQVISWRLSKYVSKIMSAQTSLSVYLLSASILQGAILFAIERATFHAPPDRLLFKAVLSIHISFLSELFSSFI